MSLPMVSYESLHAVYVFTVQGAQYSTACSHSMLNLCVPKCVL